MEWHQERLHEDVVVEQAIKQGRISVGPLEAIS